MTKWPFRDNKKLQFLLKTIWNFNLYLHSRTRFGKAASVAADDAEDVRLGRQFVANSQQFDTLSCDS